MDFKRAIFSLLVLTLLWSSTNAFRCYVGVGDNLTTEMGSGSESQQCGRYSYPTCTGCVSNSTDGQDRCIDGCDSITVNQNTTTWTWHYINTSDGICSEIRLNQLQWKYVRGGMCCRTDLCNTPVSSASNYSNKYLVVLAPIVSALLYL